MTLANLPVNGWIKIFGCANPSHYSGLAKRQKWQPLEEAGQLLFLKHQILPCPTIHKTKAP
jgi:hypothetical protein